MKKDSNKKALQVIHLQGLAIHFCVLEGNLTYTYLPNLTLLKNGLKTI